MLCRPMRLQRPLDREQDSETRIEINIEVNQRRRHVRQK